MRDNVYDSIKLIGSSSLKPQSFSGSTAVNGAKVDTVGVDNAAIYAYGVAASGAPAAATLTVKLQESLDGSTNWADAKDNTGTVIGFTLTTTSADAEGEARIEGLNLNRMRFLRAVITPAFTSGTSPASIGFAQVILGNLGTKPANTTVSNT
jgi:hypothetical protein